MTAFVDQIEGEPWTTRNPPAFTMSAAGLASYSPTASCGFLRCRGSGTAAEAGAVDLSFSLPFTSRTSL